ncbi:hypothetical protein QJS04_geneDACA013991 [Acorus gramineus]|uniref:Uncharacterized protein n=1 Tax=Acorus gramineus TaxID=55184 RepID=A0AAV9AZK0_ACOGR|nr:hypothetical protein QJS04_geneDACA013991 [Acorus gramineus]
MALLNPTRLTSLRRSQPLPSLWKTKKSSSVTVLCVPPQKQGSHSQEQEGHQVWESPGGNKQHAVVLPFWVACLDNCYCKFDKFLVGKLASFYIGLSLVVAPPLSNNVREISAWLRRYSKTDAGNMCEPCNGKGWLLCDFCQGQKTNVKAENNRIYRRCPSCKAIGYVLCSKCRVFKCVTFPDYSDGELVK